MTASGSLHAAAAARVASADQRYTAARRDLVETMLRAGRPLTIAELIERSPGVPQSSAYRNLAVLVETGVADRLAGNDDRARFELAESLLGHHHHLICGRCGRVEDVASPPALEKALGEAAVEIARRAGYEITDHRLDLEGLCPACRSGGAAVPPA